MSISNSPRSPSSGSRFRLPSFRSPKISLTAGTNIPPLTSPSMKSDSPSSPTPQTKFPQSNKTSPAASTTPSPPSLTPQQATSSIRPSVSPSTNGGSGSGVRKFLSLKSLNSSYHSSTSNLSSPVSKSTLDHWRPTTASTRSPSLGASGDGSDPGVDVAAFHRPSLNKKRSASWFRRKSSLTLDDGQSENTTTTGDRRQSSVGGRLDDGSVAEDGSESENLSPVRSMPSRVISPPPRLPELGVLDEGGSFGAEDLFKDIE
ncbi:MAG: hypothetical protein M1827_005913 [Pycnora praestabilis]|nr:MAG: hypothetical protein M1827_005913 [Pycnora praestabilis]